MLRIYCMQQWFNLSDPAMEDTLYDSESMRRFAGIELSEDAIPDETAILCFRHLLEKHTASTAAPTGTAAESLGAPTQPPALGHTSPPGARLPCGQAAVGLHQGALPRAGQEHRARLCRLCPGEPVSAATTFAHASGSARLVRGKTTPLTHDPMPHRSKTRF
jgi:hypothetical protein